VRAAFNSSTLANECRGTEANMSIVKDMFYNTSLIIHMRMQIRWPLIQVLYILPVPV
jgi:hypothetical protein